MKTALQIDITFEQILSLIKQLPKKQKLKLTKELEKEAIDIKLSRLLNTFKTEDLDLDTITNRSRKRKTGYFGHFDFFTRGKIKIRPNPVKTTFVVETPKNEDLEFVFRDITGRQIHIPRTGTKNEFNAAALQAGVYFVTAKSETFQGTARILKLE